MQKTAEDIRKLEENLIEIYAAKCGKDPKDIRQKIEAETYFNAKEAVEYGLADVVDESSSVKNLRTPTNVLINGLPADSKYFEHAPADFFTAVAQAPADNVNPPPKKESKMDLAQLKAEYPDLIASLQAEAVKQGVENDIIELLKTLETRKHLLLFFPYKFIFNDKYEFLAGIAQIQNALNSDFRCAMQYRTHEVGADFDTYIAFIYDDKIVFMIENAAHLSYIDSVNLTKSPVYMRLLDYSW